MRQLHFDLKIKHCFLNWNIYTVMGESQGKKQVSLMTVLEAERWQNS